VSVTSRPIKNVADRARLAVRHEPYWHALGTGRFVGVRKSVAGIAWKARYYDVESKRTHMTSLGDFATKPDNERFDAACGAAAAWFDHLSAGGAEDDATVDDACKRYVKHLRAANKTKTADEAEQRFARYVNPPPPAEHVRLDPAELERDEANRRFAKIKLRRLAPAHVADWLNRLRERPNEAGGNRGGRRSDASVNRDVTPFRAALNLARDDRLVTTDEAWRKKLVPIKGAERRREGAALMAAQRARFIQHCEPHLARFATALALLPLRPGVVAALKVQDFKRSTKFVGPMLDLGRQEGMSDDKGHSRMIPLSKSAGTFFESMAKDKLPGAWLFTQGNGKPWDKDAWKKPVKAAVHAARLPAACTLYWLRHATITDLVSANEMDLNTIAKVAGTSVRMIEKNYGHLRGEATAAGLEILALPDLVKTR
jgi:integrase